MKSEESFESDKLKLVPPGQAMAYGPRGACFSLPRDFIHGLIAGGPGRPARREETRR